MKEAEGCQFVLSNDPQGETVISIDHRTLKELNYKNGDIIFLRIIQEPSSDPPQKSSSIKLDAVDDYLGRQSGQIERKRDPQYCKHGPVGMCSHCQPLDPYDSGYTEEKGIKHLSFHAYLRKLDSKAVLEEPDYRVKKNCIRHAPYPAGICSLCQPSAITLNSQPFRMTDNVEFESPSLIETFLGKWRTSGYQCFGWLYGHYEPYEVVPLGIKAVVCAIYEPRQDGSIDGFSLLEDDDNMRRVNEAAKLLNLQRVGMIYTDLRDDGTGQGKVECRRRADSFFLSANEVLFAAEQQMAHPNSCPRSSTGYYGSKFVTVVLSGDEAHDVGIFVYQVSIQATAMAATDLICATTDPALMLVKSPIATQYVPDIIYSCKNEFGSQVSTIAKPTFPVDYLLVSLSHGFPVHGDPMFASSIYPSLSKDPTIQNLLNFLLPLPSTSDRLLRVLSNFNVFIHLFCSGLFAKDDVSMLARGVKTRDPKLLEQFIKIPAWSAFVGSGTSNSFQPSNDPPNVPIDISDGSDGWTCPHCTFINESHPADSCEVCGLPRQWN